MHQSIPSKLLFFSIFVALGSLLFILTLTLGYSSIHAGILSLSPLFPFLIFAFPFTTLGILLVVRPSLDYLSDTLSFSLPFGDGLSVTLSQGFGLGVVFLSLLFFLRYKRAILSHALSSFFLVLLGWGGFTLFYTINTSQTLYELLRLFSIFFIFSFSYFLINKEGSFVRLLFIILLSSCIPILTAWYQFIRGIGYTDDAFSLPRIYGTFAHPNIFALYLIIVIAAIFLLFLFLKKPSSKIVLTAILSVVLVTFFFTYSRAAWGTFFFFSSLLVLYKYPKTLPALILLPLILFSFSENVQDRVRDVLNFSQSSSLSRRLQIWDDTLSKTQEEGKTLFGYGLNTFEGVAESLRGIQFAVNDPHSEFVRSFVEGGYVGLCIFLVFSLAPIVFLGKHIFFLYSQETNSSPENIKKKTLFFILIALLVSLFLLSFTDHVLRSTMVQWSLWAILGGALRVYAPKIPLFHK